MLYRELRDIEPQKLPASTRDFEKSALDSIESPSLREVNHTPGNSICENRLNSAG